MINTGLFHPPCGNIWLLLISVSMNFQDRLNELMESKGGKKKSSSSRSLCYEAPLGYSIEDIRPAGGIKKFRSAAYSNVSSMLLDVNDSWVFSYMNDLLILHYLVFFVCSALGSHPDSPKSLHNPP